MTQWRDGGRMWTGTPPVRKHVQRCKCACLQMCSKHCITTTHTNAHLNQDHIENYTGPVPVAVQNGRNREHDTWDNSVECCHAVMLSCCHAVMLSWLTLSTLAL